jgi:hypothetical protein
MNKQEYAYAHQILCTYPKDVESRLRDQIRRLELELEIAKDNLKTLKVAKALARELSKHGLLPK